MARIFGRKTTEQHFYALTQVHSSLSSTFVIKLLSPDRTSFKNWHQFSYSLKARGEAKHRKQQIRPYLAPLERLWSVEDAGCWVAEEAIILRWKSRSQWDSILCSWAHHGLRSLAGRLTWLCAPSVHAPGLGAVPGTACSWGAGQVGIKCYQKPDGAEWWTPTS